MYKSINLLLLVDWILHVWRSEPVFADLFRRPGIDFQPGGPVRQPYFSYRPVRLHRLAKSIPGLHKRLQIRAQVYFRLLWQPQGKERTNLDKKLGFQKTTFEIIFISWLFFFLLTVFWKWLTGEKTAFHHKMSELVCQIYLLSEYRLIKMIFWRLYK